MSMSPHEQDGWDASLFDMQADLAKRAVNECVRLRARVRELESAIKQQPSTLTGLQDRVTMLEQLLKARSS
ncbi:hypothetical protein [Hydrogenophaga sp.]|uniref:hypothetical protein n=1 Tax=Hydrogenophaga sp. TaxID=1904254 RepID=UPI003F6F6B38